MNRKQRRQIEARNRNVSQASGAQFVQTLLEEACQHHKVGKLAEAEALYRKILAINPNHPDGLHLLGLIASQTGHQDTAIELVKKAMQVRPGIHLFHNTLGNIFAKIGRPEEAIEEYKKAIAINPQYAGSLNNLGDVLRGQGKLEQAMEYFKQAIAIAPNLAEAHLSVGLIFSSQHKLEEAMRCFEQALTLRPHYPEAFLNIGNVHKDRGHIDSAVKYYEQAIALHPHYAPAYNNLGNIFKEDQGKLEDAVKYYEQALTINPRYAEAHYNLGEALIRQNKSEAAIIHFRHYLELEPSDRLGARALLASLGAESMPERASEAHLQHLYTKRASIWDSASLYRGHILVAEGFSRLYGGTEKLDILDAGCGTGLVAPLIRSRAKSLEGVDFSEAMLEKAKARGIYDALHHGDLVAFLAERPEKYDAIACAATLIHFGDLRPAFEAVAIALRNNGLFIATLFPNEAESEGNSVVIDTSSGYGQGGCYSHGRNYIRRLAEETGFILEMMETEVHEHQKDKPIMGLVIGLRRQKITAINKMIAVI